MAATINGKRAGCDLCAFAFLVEVVTVDESKPATYSPGTRVNAASAVESVQHECRPCKTVSVLKCIADADPRDLPAALLCARFAAK